MEGSSSSTPEGSSSSKPRPGDARPLRRLWRRRRRTRLGDACRSAARGCDRDRDDCDCAGDRDRDGDVLCCPCRPAHADGDARASSLPRRTRARADERDGSICTGVSHPAFGGERAVGWVLVAWWELLAHVAGYVVVQPLSGWLAAAVLLEFGLSLYRKDNRLLPLTAPGEPLAPRAGEPQAAGDPGDLRGGEPARGGEPPRRLAPGDVLLLPCLTATAATDTHGSIPPEGVARHRSAGLCGSASLSRCTVVIHPCPVSKRSGELVTIHSPSEVEYIYRDSPRATQPAPQAASPPHEHHTGRELCVPISPYRPEQLPAAARMISVLGSGFCCRAHLIFVRCCVAIRVVRNSFAIPFSSSSMMESSVV